mmetsp:Transcript_6374/g.15377  ORF Transcript_6374/g.15377 Transcript_6374/m.15377 type:complete len:100 (-) Transcript_6374:214-513(-)
MTAPTRYQRKDLEFYDIILDPDETEGVLLRPDVCVCVCVCVSSPPIGDARFSCAPTQDWEPLLRPRNSCAGDQGGHAGSSLDLFGRGGPPWMEGDGLHA